MKRIFLMLLLCFTYLASWAYDFVADGIYYYITSSTEMTVKVTSFNSLYNYNEYTGAITIPEAVTYKRNTYRVTSIGNDAFSDCSNLISITIPESVTSIGSEAFYNCSSLASITFAENSQLTLIGRSAFSGCSSLTSITIPEGVTSIVNGAFKDCSSLTSITIPEGVTVISVGAFDGCSSLTSITIPEGVTESGPAFNGCSSLTEVHISSIEAWCNISFGSSPSNPLYYAHNLYLNGELVTELVIPEGVTSIGSFAFRGCSSLTSITIPEGVTSIGSSAFRGCSSLTSITIPESVTSIEAGAFGNCTGNLFLKCNISSSVFISSKFDRVTVEGMVSSLDNGAFTNCNIKELVIIDGDNPLWMGNSEDNKGLFSNCTIMSIYLGRNLDYNKSPFSDNDAIVKVYVGNSVTEIGSNLFGGCDNICSLTISDRVSTIGYKAFSSPTKVIWLTNTPPIGYKYAVGRINYVANEQYADLDNVQIYTYLTSMFEVDGVTYVPVSPSERTCHVIDCDYDDIVVNLNIDDVVSFKGVSMKITEIMPYAFYKNDYIKTVSISFISNIGDYAFSDCSSLRSVAFGDGVGSLGFKAFCLCTSLQEIVIPNSMKFIGSYCFSGCSAMKNATIETAHIPKYMFSDCIALQELNIENSVNSIGDYAFLNCVSLADVIIKDRTTPLGLGSNGSASLFSDCSVDSVYIGGFTVNTSNSYKQSPFYSNVSLRVVTIDGYVTEVFERDFFNCCNLEKVTIGDVVNSIDNYAFHGCSRLASLCLGRGLRSIGENAFSDCVNLMAFTIHAEIPPICGTQALDDINKWSCVLQVPICSISAYQTADQWKDFFFIEGVAADISPTNLDVRQPTIVYDLNGRRININEDKIRELTKGLYILNGRKLLIN